MFYIELIKKRKYYILIDYDDKYFFEYRNLIN